MSGTYTYPGVYIQELPSVVHTIVGVPTAITAFVGAAARGPINDPTPISGPDEYGRTFGGDGTLALDRAISLFFMNGGGEAIIVRVGSANAAAATATLPHTIGSLDLSSLPTLQASSPGVWANTNLKGTVDQNNLSPTDRGKLFNLTLTEGASSTSETYGRVSIDPSSPRSLSRLLANSGLVTVGPAPAGGGGAPPAGGGAAPPAGGGAAPAPEGGAAPPAGGGAAPPAGGGAAPPAGGGAAPAAGGGAAPAPEGGAAPAAGGGAAPPAGGGAAPAAAVPAVPAPIDFSFSGGTAGDAPTLPGDSAAQTGIYALLKHNTFFNLLVITPLPGSDDVAPAVLSPAAQFAYEHRAMLIADAPSTWTTVDLAVNNRDNFFGPFGTNQRTNAAVYFPRLSLTDPTSGSSISNVGPAAAVAGLYAATDTSRGVWKAPAGIAVQIGGVDQLALRMSDFENGLLNPVAVNCLRTLPVVGNVIWGARTMEGDDVSASQWKYIPIRRLALYIEESLYRGTQWVVFEPNDEPLWAQVRLNVGSFMQTLFLKGAFQGTTAKDAYFVKCDKDTNPQTDIDNGILNMIVGFAPLKPAEFVVIKIQQINLQSAA
jgi:phage tail sheath protein FI